MGASVKKGDFRGNSTESENIEKSTSFQSEPKKSSFESRNFATKTTGGGDLIRKNSRG